MAVKEDASPVESKSPDPEVALVDAVRDLAREVNGQPPPEKKSAPGFTGRQLLTLATLAIDLALLAMICQGALESPLAKALGAVAPILFSGAVVGWHDQLRDWMQRLARRRLTLAVALPAIIPLSSVLVALPVSIRTDGTVTVQLDSVARLSPGRSTATLWVHGMRPHTLQVAWADTIDDAEAELHLDWRDYLASLALAVNALARPGRPSSLAVAPLFKVNVRKPRGTGTLQLTGAVPRLLRRELGRRGWSVQPSGATWSMTHALTKDRIDALWVPGGRPRVFLIMSQGTCAPPLDSILRPPMDSIAPRTTDLDFGDEPCGQPARR